MGIVGLCRIEAVGVGRVHPPGVRTIVEETFQVFPIDGTCLRTEGIVDLHTRGVVHAWRPDVRQSALRPRLERHQQCFLVELAELLRLWPEAGPDANHEVGVLCVYVLNHLRTVGKVLREEIHSVPQVVGTPVLPVLDDAVQRHLQLAVLIDDALRLGSTLVAFLRLPETVCPQREHRHIACQVANLGDDTISTAAIHEVIVNALTGLRGKRHSLSIVLKQRRRVVFPIEAPALDALQHVLKVLQIRLFHAYLIAATVHLAVLDSSQAIDGFALVERESLANLKLINILPNETPSLLPEKHLALARHKRQALGLWIQLYC